MGFSIEYLEAFTAAVETGSFSAAARRLGKAQSRISTAIANLEIDLGVELFHRSGRYPTLTPQGEHLLREAREILSRCRALSNHADILAGGVPPTACIAVDELIPSSMLAELLEGFAETFPHTDVEIITGVMGDVGKIVISGRAEAGIEIPIGSPSKGCDWRLLGRMDFCVVAAPHHPLAALKRVTPEKLAPHRQLVTISNRGEGEPDAYLFGTRIWHCQSGPLIKELIQRGQGWGSLPRHQVSDDIQAGRLVELPLTVAGGYFQADICFVWEKGRPLLPTTEWLAEALTAILKASHTKKTT